ncbi:MAG: hypothetical protein GXP50_13410, partial [Deltaproteobacteria bacterium]|nr:hypothetical protein [Deltaproteobacteria bacterium]
YGVNMYADLTSAPYAVSVTPIVETEPVLYSDPTLGDAGAASARIWTGLDAQLTTVSGSVGLPSVRGRAWAQLDVTPGEDPWWSTSTGVDLGGTFALELFGIEILGHDFDFKDLAVERIARAGAPAFGGDPDVAAGETLRWARDIHVADSVYGDVPVDVLHLGGGELLVVERSGTAVVRLDAQGNVLWTTSSNTSGLAGAIPFDGGILMVGGSYRRLWTRELDPDGNPVGRNYVLTPDDLFGLHGVLPFDDAGKVGFIAYGYIGGRAFVARLSYDPSAGEQPLTAVWAKSFRFGGGPFGGGVIVDQGVVLANMGNVLKLDMDGNVVWTTAVEAEWGREFRALAVLPDGDIVAVGGIARPVPGSYRYQSAWVARFDGETGHLRQERTLGEDLCPRGIRPFFGGSGPGCIQAGYTTPGSSIYDTLYDLAVLPDGSLVATGKTSISEMRNLWVVRLSPTDLRVVWHVTVSGKGWDEGVSVTDAGDGIAVLGQTTSPAHKGLGESTDFPDLLLLKLPYDGGLRFARGTGMQLGYNKPDMVRPWGALGAIRNPPYTVQDVDLGTAVSENPTFSHGPAEVYDLDPW